MALILGERKPRTLRGTDDCFRGTAYYGAEFTVDIVPVSISDQDSITREVTSDPALTTAEQKGRRSVILTFKKCCVGWSDIQNEQGDCLPFNDESKEWIGLVHSDIAAVCVVEQAKPNVTKRKRTEEEIKNLNRSGSGDSQTTQEDVTIAPPGS